MSDKIVFIDGHSILNRAFYGVPELTNASGLHTNAVFGFLNMMFKIIDEEQPQYLAVAFDVKAPTFRHLMYDAYKGTRKPMPQELHEQVPIIKEVLQAMQILVMEQPGLEADDILGTMAKRAEREGFDVSLVSGDRDLLQIATEHIKIRIPKTKGGKTEVEDYYAKDVEALYHVTPLQFIELKALMGDTADNIPGVPKIGEKTATELMVTYGSLDEIYAHLDDISKNSIRESLRENKELADLSKKLATICIDGDIPYEIAQARLGELYTAEAYELFKKLEFKAFFARFSKEASAVTQSEELCSIDSLIKAEEVFMKAMQQMRMGIGITSIGVALSFEKDKAYFLKITSEITEQWLKDCIAKFLDQENRQIAVFDIKKHYNFFAPVLRAHATESAQHIANHFFDIMIGAFLLNPLKNDYESTDVAIEHLAKNYPTYAQEFGKAGDEEASQKHPEAYANYVCREAMIAYGAATVIQEKLDEAGMDALFRDVEMPLTLVLYEMQTQGIRIKPQILADYGVELNEKITLLEREILKEAGTDFNINSPKQLGEVLFEQMCLPGGKKTKTGYSTAADVLDKLAVDYPFVKKILEYRGLTKLKSTYIDGLREYIGEDERIHSTFNQTITATGRISSTEPNLQNIPIRMEMGRLIRKAFVPKDGCIFMDADYSQIELRILAHMSQDEQLIEAYRMAEDIHRITASKVFHTPFEEVTDLQRRNAKAVNFGIVYGISSFGLSQDLSISTKEASTYIKEYFETYPSVKAFLDGCVSEAKDKGYSVTMFQRRRPMPELKSSNFMQRSFGERVAMNAPIQGTAADIMKIAMIKVRDSLIAHGLESRILLQVHDELLLEVHQNETEIVERILTEEMEHAANLAVHLDVDVHTGNNWYEAK